jgi:hypothetical protein
LLEVLAFHQNLSFAFWESSLVDKSALAFFRLSSAIGRRLLFSKHGLVRKVTWRDNELFLSLEPSFFDAWHTFCFFAVKQSYPARKYSETT